MLVQEVQYEWKSVFCKKCQALGHNCEVIERKDSGKPIEKVWQPKPAANKRGMQLDTVANSKRKDPVPEEIHVH